VQLRRDILRLAMACVLSLTVGGSAGAIPAGTYVTITIDGAPTSAPLPLPTPDGDIEGTWDLENCVGACDGGAGDLYDISLSVFMKFDPQILYAGSVIDFGTPSTFGFIFSQGIALTTAPGTASHTYSASATDGTPGPSGAMTVTPVAPPAGIPVDSDGTPEVSVYTLSTNGGTTFLNAELDLGPLLVVGGTSATHGPFNPASVAGPAGSGSYDVMRVDVNFSLTGGNDAYTFNGEANIVPEPGLVATLALGFAALALQVRRRLRR
jgi:hypothetical protein